jgi:esterase/lipase superfamily enzyme
MGLERAGLEPMIYVCPNGWNTYYSNYYDGSLYYMDMFVQELIPHIDGKFRTIADREHRAVVGYSMGGFGAMVLPMKHPEMFSVSVPLSMSFRTDEQYKTESQSGWNNQWGKIFGGVDQSGDGRITEYYKQHCPLYQFVPENKAALSQVHWFLTCGDNEEQLLVANDALHQLMRDNGYDHEYRVGEGGHSSSYWRPALDEALPYILHCFAGGGKWTRNDVNPQTPEITRKSDGVFLSKGFTDAGSNGGTALYLVHNGLSDALLTKIISILQRGNESKKFAILPCNTALHDLSTWISHYEADYKVGGSVDLRSGVAVGEAGKALFSMQNEFSRLYFESAAVADDLTKIVPVRGKFYYMGQGDEGAYYHDIGALYKACRLLYSSKSDITMFEYRCRNTVADAEQDLLVGFEKMKPSITF